MRHAGIRTTLQPYNLYGDGVTDEVAIASAKVAELAFRTSRSRPLAILNVSYDAAMRLMLKMKGVADFGTPTRRYKPGRKLRISGKNLCQE